MADDLSSLNKETQNSYVNEKEQNNKEEIDSLNIQEYSKNSSFNNPEILFERLNREINLAKENSKDLSYNNSNSNSRINEQQLYIEKYLDSKYWSVRKKEINESNDNYDNIYYINNDSKPKLRQNNKINKIPKPYLSKYSNKNNKNFFEGDISNNNKSTYGNDESENDDIIKNENESDDSQIINNENEEFDNNNKSGNNFDIENNYEYKNMEEKVNKNESDINKIKSIKINNNILNIEKSDKNNLNIKNNINNNININKDFINSNPISYEQFNFFQTNNNCSKINPFFYSGFSGTNKIGSFIPSYNNYISTSNYLINNINKNIKNYDEKKLIENNNNNNNNNNDDKLNYINNFTQQNLNTKYCPLYINDYFYKIQNNNMNLNFNNNNNNNLVYNDINNNFINPSMNILYYNNIKVNQPIQNQSQEKNNLKNINLIPNQNKQLSNNNTCFHKFSNDNTCYNNKNSSVDTNEQNKTKNKSTTNNICNKKNNNSEKKDNNNTNTNNHLYNNYNKGEKTNTGTGKGEKEVLNLDNIISGKDNRTTVMIRNIPIKYSDEQLIEALEEFKGKYNCLYMPYDFEKNGNKGYAFINFVNPLHILYFYEKFNGKKWTYYESSKICELNVAHFQGINEIKKHAKNYKGIKKPTFYIGDNYQKEINNNMIIPMKYLQKLKKRFPKMDYTENKNKKIFIVKSFSNN